MAGVVALLGQVAVWIAAFQRQTSVSEGQKARQSAQQCGFSCPVRSGDDDRFASADSEADAVQNVSAAATDGQVVGYERERHELRTVLLYFRRAACVIQTCRTAAGGAI